MNKDLKAGETIEAVQIAPFGQYKNITTSGKEVTQICDKEAFQNIVKNFEKELIVDVEHKSELTDDSEAAGWLSNLRVDETRGLVGDIKVSEKGAKLLNGLNYRFGSPAFVLDEVDRPEKLLSFALTNKPAMKDIEHVYNSETTIFSTDAEESEQKTEEPQKETILDTEKSDTIMNEQLIKMLGLPEDATSEMILESIGKTISELAEIKKGEADKKLDEEADKFVEELPEEVRDTVKNSYKENSELTKTIVNSLKDRLVSKSTEQVLNKEEAEMPKISSAWETYNSLPQDQKLAFAKKHKDELK